MGPKFIFCFCVIDCNFYLYKAKKSNNEMRSCLDELKKNQDLPSTLDAVEKVLDSLSLSMFMPTLDLASEILLQFLMEHALGFILGFRFKQNFMEFSDTKISIKY